MQWELDPLAGFEVFVFENGLTLYYKTYENCPFETVSFIVYAGSFYDAEGKEGTAHFLEHLPSSNVPGMTFNDLRSYFELIGGNGRFGRTSIKATTYGFFSPITKEHINKSFSIFGDMLFGGVFSTESIDQERTVILQEITKLLPHQRARGQKLAAALYKSHRMNRLISNVPGTAETVSAINRSDLENYHKTYYVPKNTTIVAVGGLDSEQLRRVLLDTRFGKTFSEECGTPNFDIYNGPNPVLPQIDEYRISDLKGPKVEYEEYTSAAILPAVFVPEQIMLLCSLVRRALFNRIRQDEALAYDFGAGFEFLPGHFVFRITGKVKPGALKKAGELVEQVLVNISKEEFEHHKQWSIADLLLQDRSLGSIRGTVTAQLIAVRQIVSCSNGIQRFSFTTFEDIQNLLTYLQPQRRFTELIRP